MLFQERYTRYDDDIVLLQLVCKNTPLKLEHLPVMGAAEDSFGNPFESYGYRNLDHYYAGRANGIILGDIEPSKMQYLQTDPIQLESSQINSGMSGGAVLDNVRNLVVGIISETWLPDTSTKDRDTAWAVNARVLTFDPFNLTLQDIPLPLNIAQRPKFHIDKARISKLSSGGFALNNAPAPLDEWIGRTKLLEELTMDWSDPRCRVTTLIGFGGEGKSCLARRWIDNIMNDASRPCPDGIFWWGFYDNPNTDEFFEAALTFMSAGSIEPNDYISANARMHLIAAMLATKRYVLILDGLEVLQHQDGDQYGFLMNNNLVQFLGYCAAQEHESFCLITSRAPLFDLMEYTTCIQRNVNRLSNEDSQAILHKYGIKGTEVQLGKVVEEWEGHALTLSLIGSFITSKLGGNIKDVYEIPLQKEVDGEYDRVHRILTRYDEHLTEIEKAFLIVFSAFRGPIEKNAFSQILQKKIRRCFSLHYIS